MDEQTRPRQASSEVRTRDRVGFDRHGLMTRPGARITRTAPGRVYLLLPNRPGR
ncbi:hypothetical protein [Streptacidiphilus rugosus]|uniref:hypothetical protein n=1 Tax=Streptacidiphilus rugosus TaxID=405783 RepID=UPI000AD4BA3A|nr:hypothetical protein [Streptacidiphilus rugosus]